MPGHSAMTLENAPTLQQLLAFYLEAGVDCALADEPVDRMADPDLVPSGSPTPAAKPLMVAAPVPASRGETALPLKPQSCRHGKPRGQRQPSKSCVRFWKVSKAAH